MTMCLLTCLPHLHCSGFKQLDGEEVHPDAMREVIMKVCAIKPLCAWNLQVSAS